MFYSMIQEARDKWLASSECKIGNLLKYMESTGKLRDAQYDAIKTYLYLKIGCNNLPLYQLFSEGKFNRFSTTDIDNLSIKSNTRNKLISDSAALALYEYATKKNDKGEQVSEGIEKAINDNPDDIDYQKIIKEIFYGVTYSDYLFSLPMGAGKTFLMAAFIYIDLYFAQSEPNNPLFAHNFIILAPSGLKSSVVPSLRTIQQFEPSWVIPEPAASQLKKLIKFEVLDQNKTAKKSNKIDNPNVQKIALYQPFTDLIGLVAVTNAEKVILDGLVAKKEKGQGLLFEESDDDKDKSANELRHIIGNIPSLSVFIDEVHHATDSDVKLRTVVNRWTEKKTVTGVIGFSGTPYLEKAEKIEITSKLKVSTTDISNTVYYYPLVDAIGNFLKKPIVKISSQKNGLQNIEDGLRAFFDTYKDKIYERGPRELTAKVGVYCGKDINFLEEDVYPLACKIARDYGFNPDDAVLAYHGGNKEHPIRPDSQYKYELLDKTESKVRIILLCQIGKEGWNCRSLTGVILGQEGACPKNMVLQTTCRCLRQVERNVEETALIYLNDDNAKILNAQLEEKEHISLNQFQQGNSGLYTPFKRYNRMDHLNIPPIDFYQLRVSFDTITLEEPDVNKGIKKCLENTKSENNVIKEFDFITREYKNIQVDDRVFGKEIANFNNWLYLISNESFGYLKLGLLKQYIEQLRKIFDEITFIKDDIKYFNEYYDQKMIRSNIRKSFVTKRDFKTKEELLKQSISILRIDTFISNENKPVLTEKLSEYYPSQNEAKDIVDEDNGNSKLTPELLNAISALRLANQNEAADNILKQNSSNPNKDRSFHYLPYHTDSNFEQIFLKEVIEYKIVKDKNLEVYFNGDGSYTEFRIKCYKKSEIGSWNYLGLYTPDFLIIERKNNQIYRMIIAETKGEIYAKDETFKDKKNFTVSEFIPKNNEKFGYNRFEYLYLEDTLSESERITKTQEAISNFFK